MKATSENDHSCHCALPRRFAASPERLAVLPHRDTNGIGNGCGERSTGLDERSSEYHVDTIVRPVISQNSHFAKRFAEIVKKTCREEHGTEVFHARIWQKSVSVFTAKVCGKLGDPRQRFPATPSRHAGDVQHRRQTRNSLQPFYCWGLAAYKPKELSGPNGR
jgi:hypothetical protein